MLPVVVPAHNEVALIGICQHSLAIAACAPPLHDEPVVVMEACTDDTAGLAVRAGALLISVEACNAGVARATGAFTDANFVVLGERLLSPGGPSWDL